MEFAIGALVFFFGVMVGAMLTKDASDKNDN